MNRQAPPRGFARAEFEQRLARAHALMAQAGLDALLLTTEPDIRYFSGFLTRFWQSPTRPWFLLIPRDRKPIAVIPGIGEPLMASTWIDDVRSWSSPRPDDEGLSELSDALREIGADQGRVGVPMGPESTLRMPLSDYQRLTGSLSDASFIDCSPIIRELRLIKSEAEIAKITRACSIACDAFDAVPDFAHAGQPLSEVFRRFKIELMHQGADDVDYLVGAASPGGYSDVISPPSDSPLMDGDVLMMDTGAVYDGYFCDFDRNFAVGSVGDEVLRANEVLHRATDAGLAAMVPGKTCADVFNAMGAVIEQQGYELGNVGRFGHGLGMQLTEWPSMAPADRTLIREGMVLTLEPGLTIAPGHTLVHEENVVVRAGGAEYLTRRAPEDLPVLR
ncbi:MAG: M24 family metallopeptidase [Gammaproteobacteria bacterium]